VEALRQVAEYHIESYSFNNRGRPIFTRADGSFGAPQEDTWVFTYATAAPTYSFDVKRTDSLVSPYEGVITFTITTYSSAVARKSEAEALAEINFGQGHSTEHTHRYVWQNGKWVVVQRQVYRDILNRHFDCTVNWCYETFLDSNIR
jgi:hypothetical protein